MPPISAYGISNPGKSAVDEDDRAQHEAISPPMPSEP